MRTVITVRRQDKVYEWTGDLPVIPEGTLMRLEAVAACRARHVSIDLAGSAPCQRIEAV